MEPMSDERLAEIRARLQTEDMLHRMSAGSYPPVGYERELLAEVERLRAREAALATFARNVASNHEHKWRYEEHCKYCDMEFSSWSADMQRQARALLAATDATTAE